MKKITIMISHIPNPRILKRIKALENDFNITLIYWDRGQTIKENFDINPINSVVKISLDAPQGKPVKRIIPLIKYIYKALKVLEKEKPCIIHVANLDMLFIAIIYKKFYEKDIKIVYEVADLPKYCFYKKTNSIKSLVAKGLQWLEKGMVKNISKLILTSPYFWSEYFSGFVDEDKYLFVPNAPYKALFDKYDEKEKGEFTIGFIGSVRYVKQIKMLIDVVDKLDKGIKIFIAGGGPGYDEIVEYSKGKTFIEIYGPYNYEKEIVSLYEKIDYVYSVYDTKLHNVKIALPNRLYEAIVCCIPIIGAKGTVLGKFIEDNKIGFTVDAHDGADLGDRLLQLIGSEKTTNIFKENCRKIRNNYYYENNARKLIDVYKDL